MVAFVAAYALDQLTKYVVIQNLALGESWPREGFFRFTHVANTGASFGLFGGQNGLLTIAALVGIGMLVLFYRTHPNPGRLVKLSLGLMLAGALGNLTDRVRIGWVTDFIDIGPWYIFNIADSAIVTGVILLAVSMLLQQPEKQREAEQAEPAGGLERRDDSGG